MKYQRLRIPGATWFFTLVTFERRQIFNNEIAFFQLQRAVETVNQKMQFTLDAFVILPDHIHWLMSLPENDSDYSTRIKMIKSFFTKSYLKGKKEAARNAKGEMSVWQSLFWEHWIRDEKDLARHLDYIHFNPVKHRLVDSPEQWSHSSFQKYTEMGMYPEQKIRFKVLWEGFKGME
jgi:putative transposase